ncbi:MAG: L-seryl-tRNA(Sec) selenium transferase [Bacteroidota bacterium]
MKELSHIPGVDKLLNQKEIKLLIKNYGRELITFSIRQTLDNFRKEILKGTNAPALSEIINHVLTETVCIANGSLKSVINATGVIIHTNLGRAPFGKEMVNEVSELLSGYSNLEFDLEKGIRSDRNIHASKLLKYITGAEDILIVNNNAAAVILILETLAKNKEVIVSRGELIEIGGSFRIPEIMAASGCKMMEVGSTNKTRISDYENSINENTGLLFKVHKSNYTIKGFIEEVELSDLVESGKKHGIPVVYDMGSGLLKKANNTAFENEPDVKQVLSTGADLVCFSGDKLLGGPQAGIIAGKEKFIIRLKKEPLMRALRVCKLTLAFLENACRYYINEGMLKEKNMLYKILNRPEKELKACSQLLQKELKKYNIESTIVDSYGQYGGGAMPEHSIKSYSVLINDNVTSRKGKTTFAENMYSGLLKLDKPVLCVLKQGNIHFNILTVFEDDINSIAKAVNEVYYKVV